MIQGARNLAAWGVPLGGTVAMLACFSQVPATYTADASNANESSVDGSLWIDAREGDASPWPVLTTPSTPLSMDDVTVFAFSQVDTDLADPQITVLGPDMVIRAWQRWDTEGTTKSQYDASYITACRTNQPRIRFIGGSTATALFEDESPTQFDSWVTRDATDAPVLHPAIGMGVYRGSLANPSYREYLTSIGKLQIDLGVDGVFFDEVNADYEGATFDGDEGFDDDHLADFNAYLLARYPVGTDFQSVFGMTAENLLRRDEPAGDLIKNFNYRDYLATKGWATAPFSPSNPLAPLWGRPTTNRPAPGAPTFTDAAEPYVYWKEMVGELRGYAQDTYQRSIYITSNGIWPFVDFQAVGLYDGNTDGPGGSEVSYVPVTNGNLAGNTSLKEVFLALKARSAQFAPGAPVVLFIDWPSGPMARYQSLSRSQQEDYWRLYGAEAYANGIFFAFFLADTTGDPTATAAGLMPFFQSLSSFYRSHGSLYHGITPSSATVTTSLPSSVPAPMLTVSDQAQPHRRIVHLVNHDYGASFNAHSSVNVTIPISDPPRAVTLASPDAPDPTKDTTLAFTYSADDGTLTTTIPTLEAYAAIVIAY
jgi:hypothetical protein